MKPINIQVLLVIFSCLNPVLLFSQSDSLSALDSLREAEGFPKFSIGIQVSVGFSEFGGQNYFSEELEFFIAEKYAVDSAYASINPEDSLIAEKSRVVQSYDPVMVFFPLGIELGYGVFRRLQLFAKLDAFWKEQSAILETSEVHPKNKESSIKSVRKKFGVLSANVSAGVLVQVPKSWIFLNPHSPLLFTYSRIWGLPQSEIYSTSGVVKAHYEPYGIGQEFALGMSLGKFKNISVYSELALSQMKYSARGTWGDLLLQPEEANMEWSFQSIKFNFLFNIPLF